MGSTIGCKLPPHEIHEAGIGLGSNLGKSMEILLSAWRQLQNHSAIDPVALSAPYRSQPVGMISANWFVNAAALVRTRLSPCALLQELQAIEEQLGRIRPARPTGSQDRTLDLDLLFYDDLVLDSGHLVIPHPRLHERLFVLAPLAEIAGDRIHPLSKKPMRALLSTLEKDYENQAVERVSWPG